MWGGGVGAVEGEDHWGSQGNARLHERGHAGGMWRLDMAPGPAGHRKRLGPVRCVQVMRGRKKNGRFPSERTFGWKRSQGHESNCKWRCRLEKKKKKAKHIKPKNNVFIFPYKKR